MATRLTRESRLRRKRKRERIADRDLHEELHEELCEIDPCTCPLRFNGDILLWP